MINEEKVLSYLAITRHDPLYFAPYNPIAVDPASKVNFPKLRNINDLVLQTLRFSRANVSWNTDNQYETGSSRMRSVIDIWRHILYIKPKTKIFTVMNSIYNLVSIEELGGHYCCTVLRRVFLPADIYKSFYHWNDLDEFGLTFFNWKNIGKEDQNEWC